MKGKILGFDISQNKGTISGDDGKRYSFSKENWKENQLPTKELKVDFDISQDGMAVDIYQIRDSVAENNEIMMGLISVAITLFFAFIGTFISRVFISKEPISAVIMPTLIHFIFTLIGLVPVIGWAIFLIATLYYMVQNYKLVMK